jgi:hypothetical protein
LSKRKNESGLEVDEREEELESAAEEEDEAA